MEERYMNVRRRRSDYRDDPSPRRMATRRSAPSRQAPKPKRRSAAASVASGFYKALVIISALIVAVYIGFSLMIKPPEQEQPPGIPWDPTSERAPIPPIQWTRLFRRSPF